MTMLPGDYVVLPKHRLAFIFMQKAASRSARVAVARGLEEPDLPWHETRERLIQSPDVLSLPPDYFVVGFCRDPWTRALSCWANKVYPVDTVSEEMAGAGIRPGMRLEGFVEALVSASDDQLSDKHVRPQYVRLFSDGRPLFTRLVRFERLTAEWKSARRMIRGHCGLRFPRMEHFNASHAADFVDHGLSNAVRQRYAVDCELLGYS